ncbi:laccase A [Mycena olivaceomarginata]|nr:laccase A [Mycena olivaceomarginata]
MLLFTSCLAFSALAGTYATQLGPSGTLEITNQAISPDGYSRTAVLANGQFPGPLVTAKKGDRFRLNVVDKLTEEDMLTDTSIHWHGLFQKRTAWADGVSWVTQCPITTGHSFMYDFEAPDQAGTFWYHSHLSTQYCDGLRGAMIIYDPKDPARHMYDVDDAGTVLTLSDWYHYNSFHAPKAGTPLPQFHVDQWSRTPLSELAVVNVSHGKRYRQVLSLLHDSAHCAHTRKASVWCHFRVNRHGSLDGLTCSAAGQRYSFVLTANQAVSNYWIRARPISPGLIQGMYQGFVNGTNSAILRYSGAPKHEPKPVTLPASKYPLVETSLHPLVPSKVPGKHAPGAADVNLRLDISFNASIGKYEINGATYASPQIPVLLQLLSHTHTAQELLPKGSVYELPRDKVIEVTIPGGSIGGPHPFHLHGHNFHVVRSAGNATYNWDNPVIRDVVNTGNSTDDLTTFRFKTDNAGPWILHCHIDWHLSIGLAVVLAEQVPEVKAQVHPPLAWWDLCPLNNHTAQN